MTEELMQQAKLARTILGSKTPYGLDKRILMSLFSSTFGMPQEQVVALRLAAIDGYYSTNMAKRHYWIDDIVAAFGDIGHDDNSLKDFFLRYIASPKPNSPGSILLNNVYGITNEGLFSNRAHSLLSKYAYFLTSMSFPIYDSLVKDSYDRLSKVFTDPFTPCSNLDDVDTFFERFEALGSEFGDFDLLDNLLWLVGKIKKGSLSLLLEKERYIALVRRVKGKLTAEILCDIARNDHQAMVALGEDLCRFIAFTQELP